MSSDEFFGAQHAPTPLSIGAISTALVCCVLFLYQLNFAAVIGDHPRTSPAGIAYYGLYIAVGLGAVWSLMRIPGALQRAWPALLMTAVFALPAILYPIGSAERDYVENMAIFATIVLLAQTFPQQRIAYISAGITTANAALCLIDVWRPIGLTYTDSSRGAALFGNPNLAAISLLLGTLIVRPALPKRLVGPFLVLAAAGLFATLSRSTILIAALVTTGSVGWALIRKRPFRFGIALSAVGTAALLAAWIAGACLWNPGLNASISEAVAGVQSASFASGALLPTDDQRVDDAIAAIQKQAAKDGAANSITARTMLLSSSLEMARRRPFTGYGLTVAQAIAPHNTFLLFVLAFGWGGLLIPLGLVGVLTFYAWRNGRSFAIPATIFGVMWVSHDLMLSTDLAILLPLAFVALDREATWPSRRM